MSLFVYMARMTPPSATTSAPVMKLLSSEMRKAIRRLISETSQGRPRGFRGDRYSRLLASLESKIIGRVAEEALLKI